MEEFDNNLALTSGIGLSRVKGSIKKRITAGEYRLSDQVKRIMGQANGLYVQREYGSALDILQKVIEENPQAYPAWNTLGLVHEELGNTEKSLQFRMTAALLSNDNDLWKELAQKSIECNATRQAIHCFSKVISNNPSDVDALWDRAFLYKQLDQTRKAIEGFKSILDFYPHHFKVINELAQLYRSQGRTIEAIQMYEHAIVWHSNHNDDEDDDEDEDDEEGEEDGFKNKLGYSEINMLSELYLILNDYKKALNTIKTGLRLVQKRQNETWWVDRDDDDEYLEKDESRSEFPIELRVRMGVCRVYLNQVRLGTEHFKYLLQYPATTYPDLHQDIAYAYYDKRHYELALQVFQRIIDVSDEIQPDLIIKTGDCFREIGDLETAAQFYKSVLEEQNDNVDVLMSLATVYEEQGKEDEALQLVDYVMQQNRNARKQKKLDLDDGGESSATAMDRVKQMKESRQKKSKQGSLFDETNTLTKTEAARQRKQDDLRRDEEKSYSIMKMFQKLDELDKQIGPNLKDADRTLMRDYMRNAQEVWEDFITVSAFFPAHRSVKYTGFYALRRGKRTMTHGRSINMEAHSMASRLRKVKIKTEDGSTVEAEAPLEEMDEEEEEAHKEDEEKNRRLVQATQFRGVSFDKWLFVFIRYAYILAFTRRVESAFEILKKAAVANVFYFDNKKKVSLRLAMIGCGIIGRHEAIIQFGARWLCNFFQFQNDPYRLYIAVIHLGNKQSNVYASQPQLKYLMRNIRLMDALVASKRKQNESSQTDAAILEEIRELNDAILSMNVDNSTLNEQNYDRFYDIPTGNITSTEKAVDKMGISSPNHVNPVLLTLFGNLMSASKNPLGASLFFMRSYAIAPKDRLNTLCLGLALLHTAVQRISDNRHLQIMQGMMFVFEYAKLTNHNQEAEYNIGRAFHLLGLTHLAVPHYEKALLMKRNEDSRTCTRPVENVYKWPITEKEEEELEQQLDDEYDLKSEAAYNLHLIYITSGSMSLAQILMLKYCSV
ncbi:hypothetical protein BD408DRAFT_24153 [Parasitella parasitica]|nr:hypothetical protein BD408DRAFT_24153 [Parasitella parasitica]